MPSNEAVIFFIGLMFLFSFHVLKKHLYTYIYIYSTYFLVKEEEEEEERE